MKEVDGFEGRDEEEAPAPDSSSSSSKALDLGANERAVAPSPNSISPLTQPSQHDREIAATLYSSRFSVPHGIEASVTQQIFRGEQDATVQELVAEAPEEHNGLVEKQRADAKNEGNGRLTEEEVDEIIWERLGGRY